MIVIRSRFAKVAPRNPGRRSQTELDLVDAYSEGFAELRASAPLGALVEAASRMSVGAVVSAFGWQAFGDALVGTVSEVLTRQVIRSGTAEVEHLIPVIGTMRFDVMDPRATAWASQFAGRDVVQIATEQRTLITDLVTRSFREGIDPREIATRLESSIGLFDRWANAVWNQYGRNVDTFIGQGMDRGDAIARATELANAYRDSLIEKRCLMIARTETIRSANQGRVIGWQQAIDAGLIDPATAMKEWLAEPDACDDCSGNAEDGPIPIFDQFSSGDEEPDAHPNCRCSIVLVPETLTATEPTPTSTTTSTGEDDTNP